METQNISIDLFTYMKLINAQQYLYFIKKILFNADNKLTYNKKDIIFNINEQCVKLLFPDEYEVQLKELLRGEE